MTKLLIFGWRMAVSEAGGVTLWFDPSVERVELYALTEADKADRVDRMGSVSALDEDEDRHVQALERRSQLPLL